MAERPPVGPHYRIGTAARLTGLTTHVIRIWERRYGALAPDRSQGGARLYSDAELMRLRLLRRAVESGHAIGQVARLGDDVLTRLVHPEAPGLALVPGDEHGNFAEEFVNALQGFDLPRAEQVLSRASVRFSPRVLVVEMLGPVLKLMGDRWASGELCTASEHIGSALVRNLLGSLLQKYAAPATAQTVVVTTLAGELHEFGALLTAVTLAMHGVRAVYLGPNLPAAQIAEAARSSGASSVALSIVALDVRVAVKELEHLLQELPPEVRILVGGQRAAAIQREFDDAIDVCATLADFEGWLAKNLLTRRNSKSELTE